MIAVYLGEMDEEKILNISWILFEDIIKELGYRLNYEAIVNYAGNSFFEKSWEVISDNNPFNIGQDQATNRSVTQMSNILAGSKIEIMDRSSPNSNKDNSALQLLELFEKSMENKAGGKNNE